MAPLGALLAACSPERKIIVTIEEVLFHELDSTCGADAE
jgi:hypothetical protein